MTASYHFLVQNDIRGILNYYKRESGPELAEDFFAEFELAVAGAIANPRSNHFDIHSGWRRANLKRFPYHFLYEEHLGHIYVLILRSDRRKPAFGLRRAKRHP